MEGILYFVIVLKMQNGDPGGGGGSDCQLEGGGGERVIVSLKVNFKGNTVVLKHSWHCKNEKS